MSCRRAALALVAAAALAPARSRAETAPFSMDTGAVLPRGRLEVGLFAPLRYGLSDRIEIGVHPLWFLVAPNAEVKVAWGAPGGVALASTHGLLYPTPLMRLLSREGTGGVVPHDVRYPHLLASSHHLLATAPLAGHLLTARAGISVARNLTAFDGPRFWSEVEWHLVWPRAAAWFTGFAWDVGLAAQGPVLGRLRYRAELDWFRMPGLDGDFALEWAGILEWRQSDTFQLRAGAKWSYAQFPYGTRLSVPFPIADAVWAFGARR